MELSSSEKGGLGDGARGVSILNDLKGSEHARLIITSISPQGGISALRQINTQLLLFEIIWLRTISVMKTRKQFTWLKQTPNP